MLNMFSSASSAGWAPSRTCASISIRTEGWRDCGYSENPFRCREETGVARLDVLNGDPETARQNLKQCCGSQRWVIEMMLERPFRDLEHVYQAAREIWQRLGHQDWLEAFSHHPRIGQVVAMGAASDREHSWAEQEQAGTAQADASVRSALAQ